LVLAPDLAKRTTISVKQEAGYLSFKPGKSYVLFYWNNKWVTVAKQTANINTTEMLFSNVPQNSLLLLVPEYSNHKERPFIMTVDGKRYWF
jgi:hypothetical protein